ncbi:MAG: hypothetical protein OXH09_04235 [Gammaproteobacteria bacterium]|nr:hypothetical protein [Gammaproteobacteria bacterium]
MPIKDGEQRREYYRQYRAKRRAEQPGERNRQDRERRAEQRKAERDPCPNPSSRFCGRTNKRCTRYSNLPRRPGC